MTASMLRRWLLRPAVRLAPMVIATVGAAPAMAAPIFSNDFESGTVCPWSDSGPHVYCWSNPAGGDWNAPGNWRDGVVPPGGADVGIDLPGPTMTITISSANVTVHHLTVYANVDLEGHALNVTGLGRINGHLASTGAASIGVAGAGASLVANDTASSLPGVALSATDGGSLTMNAVTSIAGSQINVDGATSLLGLPAVTNIDDAWIYASNGGHVSLPSVTSMTCSSSTKPCTSQFPFQAVGAGSTITLSSLTSFTGSSGIGLEVIAESGGRVQLAALATVTMSNGTTLAFFSSGTGTEIDLNALVTLPLAVSITTQSGGKLVAPSLAVVAGPLAVSGGTVSLPATTTLTNTSITVGAGGSLTLGGTPTAAGAALNVSAGGSLTASGLTSLSGGTIDISGGTSSLSLPAVTDIDDAWLHASNGGHVSLPSVTSMTCSTSSKPCSTLFPFQAAGAGSTITLASLTTFTGSSGIGLEVIAGSGALVQLGALATVAMSNGSTLGFSSTGAGTEIDLNSLSSGGYDAGKVTFLTSAGGIIVRPGGLTMQTGGLGSRWSGLPAAIAEVDLDGDGKADRIWIAPGSSTLEVAATSGPTGTGITTRYAIGGLASVLGIGDWDGDGALDVAVVDPVSREVAVFLGVGDGTFGEARRSAMPAVPGSIEAKDVNGDGVLDLILRNLDGTRRATLLGRGDGTFAAATPTP